ncbi:hypothetical protein A1QO_00790 [Vibrio genomosp. F10 str. ZF-129]|uniref:Uncharacterized protein n=1 Tax=Vibrio genomosp. F10 str. ZF-129 TaxID=1187848 RepID=A0A1E5BGC3_9VIBR|nr:hypothetical protein [Vibrio genomosp. F10]OEE35329.1 hypothetical protein A1QO_00790 [Vibrio genomosp. F10 str. ZF-129]
MAGLATFTNSRPSNILRIVDFLLDVLEFNDITSFIFTNLNDFDTTEEQELKKYLIEELSQIRAYNIAELSNNGDMIGVQGKRLDVLYHEYVYSKGFQVFLKATNTNNNPYLMSNNQLIAFSDFLADEISKYDLADLVSDTGPDYLLNLKVKEIFQLLTTEDTLKLRYNLSLIWCFLFTNSTRRVSGRRARKMMESYPDEFLVKSHLLRSKEIQEHEIGAYLIAASNSIVNNIANTKSEFDTIKLNNLTVKKLQNHGEMLGFSNVNLYIEWLLR